MTSAAPLVLLGLLGSMRPMQAVAVPVNRIRPSRILPSLSQVTSEMNLVVQADDGRGVLWVTGDKEQVDQLALFVNLFDVSPRSAKIRVQIDSRADKVSSKFVGQVRNNGAWSFEDEYLFVSCRFTVRINDDATMTLTIDSRYRGTRDRTVVRVKHDHPVWVRPGYVTLTEEDLQRPTARQKRLLRSADEHTVPIIRVDGLFLGESDTWSEPDGLAPGIDEIIGRPSRGGR